MNWERALADKAFWRHVEKTSTCWLWTGALTTKGYPCVYRNHKTRTGTRYLWELLHGPIPAGLAVLHRCDTPRCVNPDHHFLGTDLDNARDRNAKSRQASGARNGRSTRPERTARGERAGKSKLTAEKVRELRKAAAEGVPVADLARRFGLSWNGTKSVIKREAWAHVE